jgi:hypothetical protein
VRRRGGGRLGIPLIETKQTKYARREFFSSRPKAEVGPVFRSKSGDGEKWKLSVAVLNGATDRLVVG